MCINENFNIVVDFTELQDGGVLIEDVLEYL